MCQKASFNLMQSHGLRRTNYGTPFGQSIFQSYAATRAPSRILAEAGSTTNFNLMLSILCSRVGYVALGSILQ